MLSQDHLAMLDLVLDMIVPASADGRFPAASAVGVPAFLSRESPETLPALASELDELDRRARAAHGSAFVALPHDARRALVDARRAEPGSALPRLALDTVTCYYVDDRVVTAIGMEARPPWPKGYQVMAGDATLLAPVRARGKVWRDAG